MLKSNILKKTREISEIDLTIVLIKTMLVFFKCWILLWSSAEQLNVLLRDKINFL